MKIGTQGIKMVPGFRQDDVWIPGRPRLKAGVARNDNPTPRHCQTLGGPILESSFPSEEIPFPKNVKNSSYSLTCFTK